MIETVIASADYETVGGHGPATFSLTGTLPDGVTFDAATGTISGTPTVGSSTATPGGVYVVTVVATNEAGATSYPVTITVVPLLTITTTTLPNGAYHVVYGATVSAIGGTGSHAFTLDGGALPAGLTLNEDGTITGSPNAVGTFGFTVRVTDSGDPAQTDTQALSITVERGPTNLTVSKVIITSAPFGIKLGVVEATLQGGVPLQPIAGQTITFTAGATTVCTAVTNANGVAGCSMSALNTVQVILNGGVTATYAGNTVWMPASGSAGLL